MSRVDTCSEGSNKASNAYMYAEDLLEKTKKAHNAHTKKASKAYKKASNAYISCIHVCRRSARQSVPSYITDMTSSLLVILVYE